MPKSKVQLYFTRNGRRYQAITIEDLRKFDPEFITQKIKEQALNSLYYINTNSADEVAKRYGKRESHNGGGETLRRSFVEAGQNPGIILGKGNSFKVKLMDFSLLDKLTSQDNKGIPWWRLHESNSQKVGATPHFRFIAKEGEGKVGEGFMIPVKTGRGYPGFKPGKYMRKYQKEVTRGLQNNFMRNVMSMAIGDIFKREM